MPIYACLAMAAGGLIVAAITIAAGVVMWLSTSANTDAVLFLGLITFFWATTIAAIGAVGVYVIRIYKDTRGRPQYIVKDTIGVD